MNDDINTPVAVATLFELAGEVNRTRDASLARQLKQLAGLLGLLGREPRAFLQQGAGSAQAARSQPTKSKRGSPRASRRNKRRTMPKRTGFGRNCSRPASHLKTNRADRPNGVAYERGAFH
jgi:cysteinyl-tRNA synthetase